MSKNKFVGSLKENFARLRAAVIADVKAHVASLREANIDFYGYAVLPPDYFTADEPASMVVVFNREGDISPDHQGEAYYRYSVDEWENYVYEGFEKGNAELRALLPHFEASRKVPDMGDTKVAFIDAVNETILDALQSLQKEGTFEGVSYLVVWFSDSIDDIIARSVKKLNDKKVYKEFASEFD